MLEIAAVAKLEGDSDDWEALNVEFAPRQYDVPVYHFVPFRHFMTMLRERMLRLKRMDLFSDTVDGLSPIANLTRKSQMAANLARDLPSIEDQVAKRRDQKYLRGRSYAHCWHAGRSDDKNMWNKFAEGGNGVCIFSSTWHLIQALERQCPPHLDFKIGACYYRDENHPTPDLWLSNALFRKQCQYQYEQEIRIVAIAKDKGVTLGRELGLIGLPPAEKLPVNLQELFQAVVAGPCMSEANFSEMRRAFVSLGFEPRIGRVQPFGWMNSLRGRKVLVGS